MTTKATSKTKVRLVVNLLITIGETKLTCAEMKEIYHNAADNTMSTLSGENYELG